LDRGAAEILCFFGLIVIELRRRAVPLTCQIIPMTNDETNNSFDELPLDYGSAFCEAVMRFRDEWNPAAPEFILDISGKPFALSDLCGLVVGLGGHLPTNVLNRLLSEMHNARYTRLKTELADDPSYSPAAGCLLRLMNDSRAALHRLDEERFRAPGLDSGTSSVQTAGPTDARRSAGSV
jgi:hypothetical protein